MIVPATQMRAYCTRAAIAQMVVIATLISERLKLACAPTDVRN